MLSNEQEQEPMPVISAERLRERYNSILDAASVVFAESGFEGASTAEIARRAGVSEGLIYRYFRNKRDLLQKVLELFSERFAEDREAEVLAAETFAERLHIMISHGLHSLAHDSGLTRLYISEVRASTELQTDKARAMTRRSRRLWSQIFADGRAAGELVADADEALTREAVWGAIEHLAWMHLSGRMRVNLDQTAQSLTRVFATGLSVGRTEAAPP